MKMNEALGTILLFSGSVLIAIGGIAIAVRRGRGRK